MGVSAVRKQVEGSIGTRGRPWCPWPSALFVFILVANWFEALGIGSDIEWLPAPTGDINLTLALAFIVIVPVHIASIRGRGVGGYVEALRGPALPQVPLPPERLHQRRRRGGQAHHPGSPTLRQPAVGRPDAGPHRRPGRVEHLPRTHRGRATLVLNPVWKVFDLAIGAIQAFIFALLTILYFDTAMSDAH